MKTNVKSITQGGLVAALYVALTFISSLLGLSSGAIQLRFSEALCILPVFNPHSVYGLFIGCIISNIIAGGNIADIIFGSIATLLGAIFTRKFRKNIYLALLSPIFFNTLIVPFILSYAYGVENAMWTMFLTVGAGEFLSAGILGYFLYKLIKRVLAKNNLTQEIERQSDD